MDERGVEEGSGSVAAFGWAGSLLGDGPEIGSAVNDLQRLATTESRFDILLLSGVDAFELSVAR